MALPQIGTLIVQATIGQSTTLLIAKLGGLAIASSAAATAATQVAQLPSCLQWGGCSSRDCSPPRVASRSVSTCVLGTGGGRVRAQTLRPAPNSPQSGMPGEVLSAVVGNGIRWSSRGLHGGPAADAHSRGRDPDRVIPTPRNPKYFDAFGIVKGGRNNRPG